MPATEIDLLSAPAARPNTAPLATALAWSAAAYGIVQYRYQSERTATVLLIAVQLPGTTHKLQLNLTLEDTQTIGTVAAEAEQQLSTALASYPATWAPAAPQWQLLVPPAAPEAPATWESTVAVNMEEVTFAVADRPATTAHLQAVYVQLAQHPEALVGQVAFLSAVELAQLAAFGQSPITLPANPPALLHEWFAATAQRYISITHVCCSSMAVNHHVAWVSCINNPRSPFCLTRTSSFKLF